MVKLYSYIIISIETDGYPNGVDCQMFLNGKNKDIKKRSP